MEFGLYTHSIVKVTLTQCKVFQFEDKVVFFFFFFFFLYHDKVNTMICKNLRIKFSNLYPGEMSETWRGESNVKLITDEKYWELIIILHKCDSLTIYIYIGKGESPLLSFRLWPKNGEA